MISQNWSPYLWHPGYGVRFVLRALVMMLCVHSPSLYAQEVSRGVDAVLIMDSSGSMAKNDPRKLRVPAAKMFMSLLREEDRVGLISFSDNGYPVLRLTSPQPGRMPRILGAANKVSSKGVYTNIHAALSKGIEMLDKHGKAGQEKMLVLMSDGKMDVGNRQEDERLTAEVRNEITTALKEKGIKVYTIAFTESSDVELMRHLADQTTALYRLAQDDEDLHEVFSAIFETAKKPDMLPVEGGEFTIDDAIEEVTLVASKQQAGVRVFLQTPDGRKLSAKSPGKNIKWFSSHHFDMITIRNPQPGAWKLLSTSGKNRAYIVTNMSLHHNSQALKFQRNSDMVVEAWLEEDGKLLDREAVLTGTEFYLVIEDPSGSKAEFNLFDNGEYGDRKAADGRYSNTLAYENPGSYRLSLRAIGETFKREKTINFDIAKPGEASVIPDDVGAVEQEGEKEAYIKPVPDPVKEPAAEPEETTPDENGKTENEVKEIPGAGPEQTANEKPATAVVVGIFVGINVLLALIGGGVWWFLKRRKKSQEATDPEVADDE